MRLKRTELAILEQMNQGLYLMKNKTGEFMSINGVDRQSATEAGTVEKFLDRGLIRRCLSIDWRKNEKYVLTDAGREYRKI